MPLLYITSRLLLVLTSVATLACIATPAVHAQRLYGVSRTNDISTFVATSGVTPDYFPGHAMGLTAGLDWTSHLTRRFATSLEVRGNRTTNDMLIERSITFGPRIQTNLGDRYHPYVNYFIGGGTIIFVNGSTGYHEDRSPVHSLGAGMDIDLPHHLAARIDYQNQAWDLGKDDPKGPDLTFSPNLLSIGLQYHLPFRPRTSRTY